MLTRCLNLLKKITSLDIVKVFSMTSISTLVKMFAGFISVKIVSVMIGPSGVALVGQLNNFSTIILTLATGGIVSGITKYISECKEDVESVKSYVGTSVWITLTLSLICSFILIIGAPFFSNRILCNTTYFYVFIIFGVTVVFYSLNTVFQNDITDMQRNLTLCFIPFQYALTLKETLKIIADLNQFVQEYVKIVPVHRVYCTPFHKGDCNTTGE